MEDKTSTGNSYLNSAVKRLLYYKHLGDKAIGQLNENELHFTPNESSNSIAVIVQHLVGNMLSRWTDFLTSDGEKPWRQRDAEFEEHQFNRTELLAHWEQAWGCCTATLQSLTADDLLKTITIRNEPLSVIDAINRQLCHLPYHVGQIIYLAKMMKDQDWQSLSIAKGASEQYNQQLNSKR